MIRYYSLLINEKGKISLIGIKNEDKLVNKIPELKTLIGNSLEKYLLYILRQKLILDSCELKI